MSQNKKQINRELQEALGLDLSSPSLYQKSLSKLPVGFGYTAYDLGNVGLGAATVGLLLFAPVSFLAALPAGILVDEYLRNPNFQLSQPVAGALIPIGYILFSAQGAAAGPFFFGAAQQGARKLSQKAAKKARWSRVGAATFGAAASGAATFGAATVTGAASVASSAALGAGIAIGGIATALSKKRKQDDR